MSTTVCERSDDGKKGVFACVMYVSFATSGVFTLPVSQYCCIHNARAHGYDASRTYSCCCGSSSQKLRFAVGIRVGVRNDVTFRSLYLPGGVVKERQTFSCRLVGAQKIFIRELQRRGNRLRPDGNQGSLLGAKDSEVMNAPSLDLQHLGKSSNRQLQTKVCT